jgi:hypothetical protein
VQTAIHGCVHFGVVFIQSFFLYVFLKQLIFSMLGFELKVYTLSHSTSPLL